MKSKIISAAIAAFMLTSASTSVTGINSFAAEPPAETSVQVTENTEKAESKKETEEKDSTEKSEKDKIPLVTTAPAATTAPSPTVTPCNTVAPVPIQTFLPIFIGLNSALKFLSSTS